jgi:23S rRNA C2498 (ribose-2'-O)-methylase RlmM
MPSRAAHRFGSGLKISIAVPLSENPGSLEFGSVARLDENALPRGYVQYECRECDEANARSAEVELHV